jgi:hypothetical protein
MIKEEINFTGLTIKTSDLYPQHRKYEGSVIPESWVKVIISLPDNFQAPKKIEEWIETNLFCRWHSYTYNNRDIEKSKHGSTMIIHFEDNTSAMMFKLQGGHLAHQDPF